MGGDDKLLREIGGEPILVRQVRRALATGSPVVVTLPPDRHSRLTALEGLPVVALIVEDAREGMAASLRAGAAEALRTGAESLTVLLPDMPDIETGDIAQVMAAEGRIVRATAEDGTPGHPTRFAAELLAEFAALEGDTGAAPVIRAHRDDLVLVPLKGQRACRDLDTPADWAAYSENSDD
ncbi:nucleotidyltransferase family protein [Pelagovum pacificum]|uniref:Nucleotidyltransferase family protein n=2 Tax=Pelagovum pacificum TaxID=2588711 RepID=A0A5C5GHW7_9RHOB|nr:NTP transferase domain-containing protein [Pelagovum pacificum]QQA44953.1 NTP transferase domain-containing protein [Pelagovum pacificum]TNY34283.1 nucleotidyltransferase family protein [Pelagovum pacificum]